MTTSPKTWLPTKDKWLYRHQSGTYYARLPIRGKETWRSLRTQTLAVARTKLEELRKDAMHLQEHATGSDDPTKLTGAQVIALRLAELESDASIKESTRHYWKQIFAALVRTWPEFPDLEIRRITAEQCQDWTRNNKDRLSPTRFNNTLGGLRTLFALAIKKGARRSNPAAELRRMPVRSKDLSNRLPTRQQFLALVNAIRTGGGRFSKASADLVEFLAYTGVRLSEARWIQWRHCDFTRGEIVVAGDPVHATKNGEIRRLPMTQACRALLERIKHDRGDAPGSEFVMRVNEAQKALDRSLDATGLPRITHHDLRHYFATICIESAVDIPTVAKWLGHKDGGALAMKVYGHLRNEHSLVAASRVSFDA